jgi:hypothetical protein
LLRCAGYPQEEVTVRNIKIGDITIDAVIEREGPWRRPQDFFPTYDETTFKRHLPVMEPEVFDLASGMMFITYQTFVVRTPHHTIPCSDFSGANARYASRSRIKAEARRNPTPRTVSISSVMTGETVRHTAALQMRPRPPQGVGARCVDVVGASPNLLRLLMGDDGRRPLR